MQFGNPVKTGLCLRPLLKENNSPRRPLSAFLQLRRQSHHCICFLSSSNVFLVSKIAVGPDSVNQCIVFSLYNVYSRTPALHVNIIRARASWHHLSSAVYLFNSFVNAQVITHQLQCSNNGSEHFGKFLLLVFIDRKPS